MTIPTGVTRTIWTPEAIRQLGMTTDVATAGAILGIGRSKAYELAKSGEFPVTVLRIGVATSSRRAAYWRCWARSKCSTTSPTARRSPDSIPRADSPSL
jgi:predicted DNA-binding transcriptional regulator AlpA